MLYKEQCHENSAYFSTIVYYHNDNKYMCIVLIVHIIIITGSDIKQFPDLKETTKWKLEKKMFCNKVNIEIIVILEYLELY